jgi:FHS family L-fucose permease-like MFS transporter
MIIEQTKSNSALYTLITVFSFLRIHQTSNGILFFVKLNLKLDQFQSQLIDFAFMVPYYIGAIYFYI